MAIIETNIFCQVCGREYKHLGSHLWHGHKILAREYKEMFELDYKYPLISSSVKEKKQIAFAEHRQKYLKNLIKAGKKYYFKKGTTNRQRFSNQSMERARQNLQWVNEHKNGKCPVCNLFYDHLTSHLYNSHGLTYAQK